MPFCIQRNDIAKVAADAVVLAANERLQLGGGTAGAMARAAGADKLQAACDRIGGCPVGSAVATPGYDSLARIIIHAVGPRWRGGKKGEADLLARAYRSALTCAFEEGARSIALPLLSSGIFGYPVRESFEIACREVRDFLEGHEAEVVLVVYGRDAMCVGRRYVADIEEYIDDEYARRQIALDGRRSRLLDAGWATASLVQEEDAAAAGRAATAVPVAEEAVSVADEERPAHAASEEAVAAATGWAAAASVAAAASAPASVAGVAAASAPVAASAPTGTPAGTPAGAGRAALGALSGEARVDVFPSKKSLGEVLAGIDEPFIPTLLRIIDERGLTDAQVYKRANLSRQHFSKMRSDAGYCPTKKTVVALCLALELDLEDTCDLLERAGYALSRSAKFDLIIRYFIERGNYDIFEVNEALFAFDQPVLG